MSSTFLTNGYQISLILLQKKKVENGGRKIFIPVQKNLKLNIAEENLIEVLSHFALAE